MSRRLFAGLAITLAGILFFALIVFSNSVLRQVRLDLTENHLFTLSAGTVKTLQSLEEPITVRLFYSEKALAGLPRIPAHARYVRDLLDAFQSRSKGKLRVQIIKPEPFSPQEDQAIAAGIAAIPTSKGDTVYFGIEASNLADGRETIPYLSPDRDTLIEYDLVSLIDRLNRLKKPVIGFLGDLPLATGPGGAYAALQGNSKPYRIYQELEKKFRIDFLETSLSSIPSDVDVLLVAHPIKLPPATLYAIDQFVLGGGHVLAFLDPLSEIMLDTARGPVDAQVASSLGPLLAAWGVSMPANEVVGDRTLAQRVLVDEASRRVAEYVPWLGLTAGEISREDPVTAEISQIALGTAGHLDSVKGAGTTLIPLLTSSEDAMILDARELQMTADPDELMRRFRPSGVRYTLAARITGTARSAFPDGPPAPAPDRKPDAPASAPSTAPQLKEAKNGINVILVADTDILDDRFWVQSQNILGQQVAVPTTNNGDFVLNAVDNLTGSNALLSLRGREIADRRFSVVDDIRRSAQTRYQAQQDALSRKLAETERRLATLTQDAGQSGKAGTGGIVITPEQRQEIDRFTDVLAQTRTALRSVQHNLTRDIAALGDVLKLINIVLMPVLVTLIAIGVSVIERRKRRRKSEENRAA